MKASSIEEIIEFFKKCGICTKYEIMEGRLNRIIEFEVENTTYFIEWWINQSYFKLKNNFNSPYLPFKYISVTSNSPTVEYHEQLCFYNEKRLNDKQSMFYDEIPFGCMRIPFNIKK